MSRKTKSDEGKTKTDRLTITTFIWSNPKKKKKEEPSTYDISLVFCSPSARYGSPPHQGSPPPISKGTLPGGEDTQG